jgi:hypothetical protein
MSENIERIINDYVGKRRSKIMTFARDSFAKHGRGYVELQTKDGPDNPVVKTGQLYYVTKDDAEKANAQLPFQTEHDRWIMTNLETYNPGAEAIVLVWYRTKYKPLKLTDQSSWN